MSNLGRSGRAGSDIGARFSTNRSAQAMNVVVAALVAAS